MPRSFGPGPFLTHGILDSVPMGTVGFGHPQPQAEAQGHESTHDLQEENHQSGSALAQGLQEEKREPCREYDGHEVCAHGNHQDHRPEDEVGEGVSAGKKVHGFSQGLG